jgi:hypothetical protein
MKIGKTATRPSASADGFGPARGASACALSAGSSFSNRPAQMSALGGGRVSTAGILVPTLRLQPGTPAGVDQFVAESRRDRRELRALGTGRQRGV